LDRLLDHSRRTVPYYRQALERAVAPGIGTCRERLARLPILRKEDVRANSVALQSSDLRGGRLHLSRTGGSTGEPLTVANGTAGLIAATAAVLRGKEWAGVRLGDRGVAIKAHGEISIAGRLRAGLVNIHPFKSCLSREHLLRTVIPALSASPPRYLTGYPTSLLCLANLMEERELHIPVIFTTGEMLYAHQREILERKFAGRVFDYYGSNEVSALAFECEYGCRHITDEQVVLEVVDDADQPLWDVSGRILVTDFRNMAMPFIRYELGDRGVLSRAPCQCGRHLLVLKELEGRSQDAIRGPNGVALSGVFFAGRFRNLERIRAYQVVQQSETVVELRYVSARPDAQTEVNEIVAVIREHLGAAVRIEERCFDTLPLTRTGKTRHVIGLGTLDPGKFTAKAPELKLH
jgi:phenylacetate-CoA ligase